MKSENIIGTIQAQQSSIPMKKHTVVVADDDLAILDAMKLMLELYNFDVETIEDGRVMTKLVSIQPKLLLLDVCMSGVDGRDICRTVKATAATKDIPVILISASVDLANIVKDSGADDYLSKPFEMQDLISKVNKYLLN
ncbi:MAG TPA: response regulator [Candidatus Acidoferrales bacterium]|nr:response regulator [Candidatus Acidoferrales bacterium]